MDFDILLHDVGIPTDTDKIWYSEFYKIFFTPDEAAQIISCCEERLLANKTITDGFTAADIQGGVLKEHLIPEDYLALQKITFNIAMVKT